MFSGPVFTKWKVAVLLNLKDIRLEAASNGFRDLQPFWKAWWRYDMEKLSVSLSLCVGNPSITDGVLAQRDIIATFLWFNSWYQNKLLNK